MRMLFALAFILALAAPAAAASSLEMANGYGWSGAVRDVTPERLGQLFCDARRSGDMSALDKFYAPKLSRLLGEAAAAGVAVSWQGYPDQPQNCAISILNGYDDTVGVMVELSYAAIGKSWSDTLNLERTPDSWLLNNVFYQGGGNLRFRLVNSLP